MHWTEPFDATKGCERYLDQNAGHSGDDFHSKLEIFLSFMRSRPVRTILVLLAIERSVRPPIALRSKGRLLFNVVGLTG